MSSAEERLKAAQKFYEERLALGKNVQYSLAAPDLAEFRTIVADSAKYSSDIYTGRPAELAGYNVHDLYSGDRHKASHDEVKALLASGRFRGADLRGTNLFGADLSGAYLYQADLRGAMLSRASFGSAPPAESFDIKPAAGGWKIEPAASAAAAGRASANVSDADFRDADLGGADLSGATGLRAERLAGARLNNARLPDEIGKFERLAHVEKASGSAKVAFVALVLGCLYCWITIASTEDVNLITRAASYALPITGVSIFSNWFFVVAPVVILSMFIYFHLDLQRLWDDLATLPAIFPDGERLDEKAYPWLLNAIVRRKVYYLALDPSTPPLAGLRYLAACLLFWWLTPLTLIYFWWRYLPSHDVRAFGHSVLIGVAVAFALHTFTLATATLYDGRSGYRTSRTPQPIRARPSILWGIAAGAAFAGATAAVMFGAIPGPNGGILRAIDLRDAVVSTRPANWDAATGDTAPIGGADLRSANLRYARADGAFLVKARLPRARLAHASLSNADLRGADLTDADLSFADLEGANLTDATLDGADFTGARLPESFFGNPGWKTAKSSQAACVYGTAPADVLKPACPKKPRRQ